MTNEQALKIALKALDRALKKSNHFDHGDWDSITISEFIEKELRAAFALRAEQ